MASAAADRPAEPRYLWLSGQLVPWHEATVHVTEVGWTAVSAVFEGIRGYWNQAQGELYVFRLDAHLKRLGQSMKLMRMPPPFSDDELSEAIGGLLRANEMHQDAYVQLLAYFRGGVPGYRPVEEPAVEIVLTTRPSPSGLGSGQAQHCCVSSWVRLADNVMPPRAKALANYQNSRLVSTEARLNGYDAGIILNSQGKVAEAAWACVFLIRDGMAITPPFAAGILESITRDAALRLLREEIGIPMVERDVDRTELYIADEVFLCGTLAEIAPVASVDRYTVGDGRPGPVTRALEGLYHAIVRGEEPRFASWLTAVWQARA